LKHERLNSDLTIEEEQKILYLESKDSTRFGFITIASSIAGWHYSGWFARNKFLRAAAIPITAYFILGQTEGWRVSCLREDLEKHHPEMNRKLNWARENGMSTNEFKKSTQQYLLQENSERLGVLIKLDEREETLSKLNYTPNLQSKRKLFDQEWNRLCFFDRFSLRFEEMRSGNLRQALIQKKQLNDKNLNSLSSNYAISRLQLINQQLDEDLSVLTSIQQD